MRTLWRSEECWIRTGECWTGLRYDTVRRQLDQCTLAVRESAGLANGGTVERWRRWMEKRILAVLDGRESAGLGHSGVAGLGTAR